MDVRTDYLEYAKNNKTPLKVFMEGGAMLTGIVTKFDDVCFVLENSPHKCLIEQEKVISISNKV